ncbi:MAG: TetR/AcrR family transcriptional regulator [Lachnospiraceae bacterium]|nr:TetR/AcrR family transcriptional regulator [Lachnospiraceae bacterium]
MREDMKSKILKMSSVYFAKNGFGDTKIGDLAKHIGIGQGTIYLYFKSKEELFEEIRKAADNEEEVSKLKMLSKLPIPAKTKINKISEEIVKRLSDDAEYAVKITIRTQLMLENEDLYSDRVYKVLETIIKQGQKEKSIVKGDPTYLADLYWGTVFLSALKMLYINECKLITKETLNRLLEA